MMLELQVLKLTLLCWVRLIFGGSQFTGYLFCSEQAATFVSQKPPTKDLTFNYT